MRRLTKRRETKHRKEQREPSCLRIWIWMEEMTRALLLNFWTNKAYFWNDIPLKNPAPHDVSSVTGINLKISSNSPANWSSLNFLSASSIVIRLFGIFEAMVRVIKLDPDHLQKLKKKSSKNWFSRVNTTRCVGHCRISTKAVIRKSESMLLMMSLHNRKTLKWTTHTWWQVTLYFDYSIWSFDCCIGYNDRKSTRAEQFSTWWKRNT